MKKIVALLGIITVCGTFFACKDTAEIEDNKIVVTAATEGNIISIPNVENLSYINIFRTCTDGTFNIGQITPVSNMTSVFSFTDPLVVKDESYTYYACYNISGVYKTSGVSVAVKAVADNGEIKAGITDPTNNSFEYSNLSFTPKSALTTTTGYHLAIAISRVDNNLTTTFPIGADDADVSTSSTISMTSLLTNSFLNVPIVLKGLILEQTGVGPDSNTIYYKTVYWSEIEDMTVINSDGTTLSSFEVDVGQRAGGDYDFSGRTADSLNTAAVSPDFSN